MFKSLYGKLVLILILLIVALMAVVGVFLTGSVARFYMDDFSRQMSDAFGQNLQFVRSLQASASAEEMGSRLAAYGGTLGIDNDTRVYYVLDGRTGDVLAAGGARSQIDLTPNILSALSGQVGNTQRLSADYFDCAVPLESAAGPLIAYIRDSKGALTSLSRNLFAIVIEAVFLGLLISVLLSLLLSKTMTTPIESITQGAARMAAGDFSRKLEVRSTDEIGVLTDTFNHMADVLHDTLETVESERDKLGTLFLHMTDGVVAFSRDGAVQHINLAARRLLALRDSDLFSYESFEPVAPLSEVSGLRPPDYLERSMTLGSRHLRLFFAPFGTAEAESGLMVVIHDTTEQTRLDDLRREFVANVSHELRTPLTGIKSYAETLMEPEELSGEDIRRFSGVIVSETDRMTRLVHDLLTLSRLDFVKGDFHFETFDLADMLKGIYELMRMEAGKRGQRLTLDFVRMPPSIRGDRDRLEQVLINIVSNALAYTPEGGRIEIAADARGDSVILSVRDDGIGIPEEDLPFVFDRFYRVDKARSRSQGGTGLGLAIAREIAERHGGFIELESAPGRGTTVRVTLPAAGPRAEEEP